MAVPLAGASHWPHSAAKNYGLDRFCEHDERYRMANEWMELVEALWNSWESDAVTADDPRRAYSRTPPRCTT